jgi:hypothetical protein
VGFSSNLRGTEPRLTYRIAIGAKKRAELAVSHLVTTRRLKVATDELQKLRQEVAYLDVADPSRIQAVQVPVVESMTWKWKLHLPQGRYWLHTSTLDIPVSDLPDNGQCSFDAPEEPFTMTVALRKDHLGQWQLVVTIPNGTMRIGIADDDAGWLTSNAGYSSNGVTQGKTQVFEPGKPLELLRVRAHRKRPDGSSSKHCSDGPTQLP